jgi:hypothetical protein
MQMNTTTQDDRNAAGLEGADDHQSAAAIMAEAVVGAVGGAVTGMLGGPPGMVAGAVIGGAIGAAAGVTLHREHVRHEAEDAQLDRDIGVYGGDIGAAPPDAPKSQRGVFHAASMGVGGTGGGTEPSEGPMQNVDQE